MHNNYCQQHEFIESFLFSVIFVRYNIGIYIYIYIYIYQVIYVHSFLLSSTVIFFCIACQTFWDMKNVLWNWWVDCYIVRFIKWCDILGVHSEPIFPFIQYFFFSRKLCFLRSPCLLLIAESISLDTYGKLTVGFFLKIASSSWIILSNSLDKLSSSDWLLKRWWWIFLK